MPSVTHIPAASPAISGVTVITEHVFTRQYTLVRPLRKPGMSTGEKVGIAVGAGVGGLAIAAGCALVWNRRRRGRKSALASLPTKEEQADLQSPATLHEMPSPGGHPMSPSHHFPLGSYLPPAYHAEDKSMASPKVGVQIPQELDSPRALQELPGSSHIHQHHPAFPGDDHDNGEGYRSVQSELDGETCSPRATSPRAHSPRIVSPLKSPASGGSNNN